MRDVILYLVLVINVVSMVAMIAGILMHSGRGGGLSDMFGGGGGARSGRRPPSATSPGSRSFALIWILTVLALRFLLQRT